MLNERLMLFNERKLHIHKTVAGQLLLDTNCIYCPRDIQNEHKKRVLGISVDERTHHLDAHIDSKMRMKENVGSRHTLSQ